MYIAKLRKVDGTIMMAIPSELLQLLHVSDGDEVELSTDARYIVIDKLPRYTLEELLAQCDPVAELTGEDREWLDAKPVGREVI